MTSSAPHARLDQEKRPLRIYLVAACVVIGGGRLASQQVGSFKNKHAPSARLTDIGGGLRSIVGASHAAGAARWPREIVCSNAASASLRPARMWRAHDLGAFSIDRLRMQGLTSKGRI